MGNEGFRRELNNAFDEMSGSPGPELRQRVRSAVAEARAPRSGYWIAAVAAILITAAIIGALYMTNPLRRPGTSGVVTPTPSPTPSASASPQPTPTGTPSSLPPFTCTSGVPSDTSPAASPLALVNATATGAHAGYDRIVVTFENGAPSTGVDIRVQARPVFTGAPSGIPITLKGQKGILVVMHGADMHSAYSGKTDFVTGYPALVEARVIEDFEGVVQLGLGVNGTGCYRAFYLENPSRLVVDVEAPVSS